MTAKNIKNLRPFNTLTESEQRDLASKGGKASAESRKKRKLLKDAISDLLNSKPPQRILEKLKDNFPELPSEEMNMQTAMVLSLINNAMSSTSNSSVSAFLAIRDTIGEKPEEKSNETLTIKIKGLKDKK